MMYSTLWLPMRFKVFRAAATACSSIEVLCSWSILCDGALSESAMTIPLKGFIRVEYDDVESDNIRVLGVILASNRVPFRGVRLQYVG